jgi:hypothetical protein
MIVFFSKVRQTNNAAAWTTIKNGEREKEKRYAAILIDYVDGGLLGGWELVGLQAACVASAGSRDGFVRMSVVLLKLRSELKTTAPINEKKNHYKVHQSVW